MRHRWNPERPGGAASLKTYFVGQCLFQFRSVYRSWYGRERGRRRHVIAADPELLHHWPGTDRVDRAVIDRDAAAQALQQVNGERARKAFVMASAGLSYAEIAAALDLADEKAVDVTADVLERGR